MLGKTVFDLFAVPEAAAYSSCDALVLAGSGVIDQEFEITFADGTIHQVIVTKFPVFGSDGQPVGMGTIDTDITSQKKIETELRQAQKMEAVGQLTGGIAHDFNNQLSVILGNLVMLEEDLADNDAHRDQIQHALDAANRGASLTHRLLAFSRNQVLAPQPTDVNELVKHLVELVRCTLGEAISVETIYADGLWQTLVDPYQLENAILNLTINARDAMPRGGKLSIEMSNTWLDEQAAVQAEVNPGEFVLLTLADGGMGIPAGAIDHVFEPFFTTKEVGQGSGLGLSMIYGFVKQSGGHISVESQIGTGATFKIYLPRSHQG
jgi:signal transduction histidine kinase